MHEMDEQIIPGTIISKEEPAIPAHHKKHEGTISRQVLRGALEVAGEVIARITIVGGIATVVLLDALDQESTSQPVAYTVHTTDNQVYIVLSSHSGFSVGDCVDLFISSDLVQRPPRMAYGGFC